MPVRVQCPNPDCGKTYRIADDQLGQLAVCKHCGRRFNLSAARRETVPSAGSMETDSVRPRTPVGDIPNRLGRFEIRSRLGSGAFGTVYRAHDPVLDREVALKVPRAAALEKPEVRARFLREPKAAAQLRHPHIVPVFDAGTDGDHYYIASAYIEGRTLKGVIDDECPDVRLTAEIVRDLANALDYAHRMGVVHRDIKPANIMVDEQEQALLVDFGLAHLESSEEELTQDGTLMGTPAYMAPEQVDSALGEVGPASDQHSLGVVLYELLVGRPPFSGSLNTLIYKVVHETPVPPRRSNPEIPRDLETICLKAMSKRSQERYADCAAMAEDLRRWLADEPILARRMNMIERTTRWARRNPAVATLVTAVILVTLAGFVGITSQWQRAQRNLAEAERQKRRAQENLIEARRQEQVARDKSAEAQTQRDRAQEALGERDVALRDTKEAQAEAEEQRDEAEKAREAESNERIKAQRLQAESEEARERAEENLAEAERQRKLAEEHQEALRCHLYAAQMNHAKQALDAGNSDRARQLLELQVPKSGEEDLRSFGWYYLADQIGYGDGAKARSPAIEKLHGAAVYQVAVSPDGESIVSLGSDKKAKMWHIGTPVPLFTYSVPRDGTRTDFDFIRDLAVFNVAFEDDATGKEKSAPLVEQISALVRRRIRGVCTPVVISIDCTMLACARAEELRLKQDGARGFRPRSFAASWREIELADIENQDTFAIPDYARPMAFSPDGRTFAALKLVKKSKSSAGAVAFSAAGIVLYDVVNRRERVLLHDTAGATVILFSPPGDTLATGHLTGKNWQDSAAEVALWDVDTGDCRRRWHLESPAEAAAFSPDGSFFALCDEDGRTAQRTLSIWRAEDGQSVGQFPVGKGNVNTRNLPPIRHLTIGFSPDGQTVALWEGISFYSFGNRAWITSQHKKSGDEWELERQSNETMELWDFSPPPRSPRAALEGHKYAIRAAAFCPDGKTFATGSEDNTIKIWDVATGMERLTLEGHRGGVLALAFATDGSFLISGSADGSIRVWRAPGHGLDEQPPVAAGHD